MLQCFTFAQNVRPTAQIIQTYLQLPETPDWMSYHELIEPAHRQTAAGGNEEEPDVFSATSADRMWCNRANPPFENDRDSCKSTLTSTTTADDRETHANENHEVVQPFGDEPKLDTPSSKPMSRLHTPALSRTHSPALSRTHSPAVSRTHSSAVSHSHSPARSNPQPICIPTITGPICARIVPPMEAFQGDIDQLLELQQEMDRAQSREWKENEISEGENVVTTARYNNAKTQTEQKPAAKDHSSNSSVNSHSSGVSVDVDKHQDSLSSTSSNEIQFSAQDQEEPDEGDEGYPGATWTLPAVSAKVYPDAYSSATL